MGPWDNDWGMFFGYFYDVIIRSQAQYFGSKFFWILD